VGEEQVFPDGDVLIPQKVLMHWRKWCSCAVRGSQTARAQSSLPDPHPFKPMLKNLF
jgi:hypothetical protein